jgi:transcription elongation factor GreA
MDYVRTAHELIAQRDFQRLDDLWTDMILNEKTDIREFFDVVKELKKAKESDRAFMLLEMLASHFESDNNLQQAIEVYKQMLYFTHDDTNIRQKLISLYRNLYRESTHLDEYIDMSGLSKKDPIFKALNKLEEFIRYDVGRYFYFERYGLGEVIDTIPARQEIIVDFEKKKRHFLTIDVARGLLSAIDKNHFLYIKHARPDELKERASSNPVELVEFLLKNFHEPLTASHIKQYMEGIVEHENMNTWWERVRKQLEKNENIQVSGKTKKYYTYQPSSIDRRSEAITTFERASPQEQYYLAEHYHKSMPQVFEHIIPHLVELGNKSYKRNPSLALDIALLCEDTPHVAGFSYTPEAILERVKPETIIHTMSSVEHQKTILQFVKNKNPDTWMHIFKKLLLSLDSSKLLDDIEQQLQEFPELLRDAHYTIFSLPKQHPQQFQWILKKMLGGDLPDYTSPRFVPKLFDSLIHVKGIKSSINKILSLEKFDAILAHSTEDEARRILTSLHKNHVLADHEKKDYLRIVEYHFPHLFRKDIDIIYSTEVALNKKKEELKHIYTVEIPENKKEISRAREYGDLSENFEYKAAKERQDQLYQKVKDIESALEKVRIINPATIDTSRVMIGTTVELKNVQSGERIRYTILGRWDTDLKQNIISNEAPLAASLLGKACGDRVIINDAEYEMIDIQKGL